MADVLGPLEAEIMDVLWADGGTLAVREVLDRLNAGRKPPLAYTTVMTVMARLAEKGFASREVKGRGYAYTAAVPDEAAIAVRNVLRDFGTAAVAHFVDQAEANPQTRQRLRDLLAEDT